jgi:hypothetical protein
MVHAGGQGRSRRVARHPALFAAELGEIPTEAAELIGQCGRDPAGRAEISEVLEA